MSYCGEAQQTVANVVQKQTLHNEITAMKAKGIQQVMDNGKPNFYTSSQSETSSELSIDFYGS